MNSTAMRDVGLIRFALSNVRRQWHKRVLRKPSPIRTPSGNTFLVDCNIPFTMEIEATDWAMDWGAETICILSSSRERVFIDIGGNIGYYTSLLAPFFKQVYCFEPDEKYVAILRRNIAQYDNVSHDARGVFSTSGPQYFESPDNMGSGGLVGTRGDIVGRTSKNQIECVSLDDFCKSIGPVGLIKIDTDGSEMEILRGAASMLSRDRPIILTEYGHQDNWDIALDQLSEFCAVNELMIYAFVRAQSAKWSEPVFRMLSPMDLGKYWWKMLFLVPSEKRNMFSVFEGTKGNRALESFRASITRKLTA